MKSQKYKKRIALFHPWIKSRGGAERVVLEILKNSKYKVDVYTWVYDKEKTFEEFKKFKINIIAPKIAQKLSRSYLLRGLFLPISLFSKIPLERYDLFLISTSGMAELITLRNYKPGKTYAYCHTPLRAANEEIVKWNLKYRYKNPLAKLLYLMAAKFYKVLEKIAWRKIDIAIFNSELSLERAQKHNLLKDKKTYVVYPPVDVEKFSKIKQKIKKGNYFLYVSRFNVNKRQDLLIKAWAKFVVSHPNHKLVLAGNIESQKYFEKIKKLAAKTKNIEIKTNLSDKEILELYGNCLAVVFVPFMEDFGIVPFEALASGKPLIAVDKGGYVKLIKDLPQFFKIQELPSEELMIEEINKTLNRFIKSDIPNKKIKLRGLDEKAFIKKLKTIFKKRE